MPDTLQIKITKEHLSNSLIGFYNTYSWFWHGGLTEFTEGTRENFTVVELTEENERKTYVVGWKEIVSGLEKLLANEKIDPRILGRILKGEADMGDADILMQFVCFGEERYA